MVRPFWKKEYDDDLANLTICFNQALKLRMLYDFVAFQNSPPHFSPQLLEIQNSKRATSYIFGPIISDLYVGYDNQILDSHPFLKIWFYFSPNGV